MNAACQTKSCETGQIEGGARSSDADCAGPKTRVLQLRSSHIFAGPETVIVELSEGLKGSEFDSTILCVWSDSTTPIPLIDVARARGLRVDLLRSWGRLNPLILLSVLRYARSHHVQLINATGYKADIVGLIVARLLGIRFVTTVQGFVEKYPVRKRFYDVMTRWIARRSDMVIAVSESLRKELIDSGCMATKVVTAHNFVDASKFADIGSVTTAAVRKEFTIPENVPVIGIFGRLNEEKGHSYFLKAAAIVNKEFPEARFFIVGESYLSLREDLDRQTRQLGLQDRVIFTGYRRDIPVLMTTCTLIVSASLREGLPLVLVEAMAASRPVVATMVDGIPELVEDGRTGRLVAPRDVAGLARAMLEMMQRPDLAAEMGRRGREVVERHFSRGQLVQKTCEVYRSALGRVRGCGTDCSKVGDI